jgi:type I restriction enzyme S subunit
MVIKEGYKQTEIGVIPQEWKIVLISKVTNEIFLGLTSKVDYVINGGFPLIRTTDISKGKLNFDNVRSISTEQHKSLTKYRKAKRGDILVSKSGSLGVCAKVDVDIEFSIYESIIVLQPKSQLDSEFLLWLLRDDKTQERIIGEKVGSSVSHLNIEMFRRLEVQIPPLTEQTVIATALSDADGLITGLEKLIAKKRNIKQGAMQQLLQPKEGWEVKKLGEIALFNKGKGLPKSHINDNGKFKCIHYGELFTKHKEYIREVISYTSETVNLFYSITNDVLMPTSDVTPNGLATASCIKESGVILGGDVLVIRISEKILDGIFLSYFITKNREQVMKLVSGSTVYHLSGSDMKNLTVYFPLIEEQTRIVSILTDMDAELSALGQKLEKYKKVKLGMMQELLTGKTRLV